MDAPAERWLFIDGATDYGGHEVMLSRWVGELARQGRVRPRVLARVATVLRERSGVHAAATALPHRAPAGRRGWLARLRGALQDARAIRRTVREEAPTLCVVAEGSVMSQPVPALVCRLLGVRVAVYLPLTQRTSQMGFRSGWMRDLLMRLGFADVPDAWIVLTRDQAVAFASWTGTRAPILVLPNTVAPEIEARLGDRRALPAAGERQPGLRVTVLGRLDTQQKGLDMLLDHAASGHLPANLVVGLVGDGPARDALARRIGATPSLAAAIHIDGWSDPVDVLTRTDVLLLPSRYEGVPLVMLEAMAMGVPVVASDLPGTRAFLDAACLFPVGDSARAFTTIEELRDPEARARTVARNRATFAAKASGAAFSAAVASLVVEIERRFGARRAPGDVAAWAA